jgi:hypothetical protein
MQRCVKTLIRREQDSDGLRNNGLPKADVATNLRVSINEIDDHIAVG